MFLYPKFKNGIKVLTRTYGRTAPMLQNITVYRLAAGESVEFLEPDMESAILLVEGEITFFYEDKSETAKRSGVFTEPPTCLHVSRNTAVAVTASAPTEILVQSTENDKDFPPKLIRKEDTVSFVSCKGKWEDTAVREVVDLINIKLAPYSNMVLGEVYARQGRWWSFAPHNHPQPEVYYYRFDRPEGFGACFIGEKAYTIKDGSCGLFEGGYTHPQVTAPGYPMYCAWMIRHLPGDPWDNTRVDDARYSWLYQNPGLDGVWGVGK